MKIFNLCISLMLICSIAFADSTATCVDSDAIVFMHMDGADASTTFTDVSYYIHTFTAASDAQIDTAQSKFGGASALFDGTGDDVLATSTDEFVMGSGNFTIDFWVRFAACADGSNYDIINNQYAQAGKNDNWQLDVQCAAGAADGFNFYVYDGAVQQSRAYSLTNTIAVDTWYHVAIVRTSTTAVQFYLDGTALTMGDATITGGVGLTTPVVKLGEDGVNSNLNGWIDELRVVRGTAVYSGNFTPQTAAYPDCRRNGQKISLAE